MNKQRAEALAEIFGGEAWDKGGGHWVAAYWRGDGKYIVFSADSVAEYEGEEAFDSGAPINSVALETGEEEWWVVGDDKGNTFFQFDDYGVGWRSEDEAERQARYLQSREGGKFFAKRVGE